MLRRPLLAIAGQVCVALSDTQHLARIYELLLPDRDLQLILPAGVPLGPVAHYLGMIASALGDREAAETHLRQALADGVNRGPWHARSQYVYGQLLAAKGRAGGREYLLEAAQATLQMGMRDLHEDIQRALGALGGAAPQRGSR